MELPVSDLCYKFPHCVHKIKLSCTSNLWLGVDKLLGFILAWLFMQRCGVISVWENNLIWPISFKIGANFTFCNHLDKFVGLKNPIKVTLVFGVFSQKFGFWSPRRVFFGKVPNFPPQYRPSCYGNFKPPCDFLAIYWFYTYKENSFRLGYGRLGRRL